MALDALIHRRKHSWWQDFQKAPTPAVAKWLYYQRQRILTATAQARTARNNITIVCISDTHNGQPKLPEGDVLIHAGDLTQGGTVKELQSQLDWLNDQPHTHKIVIAGNHDLVLDDAYRSQHDSDADAWQAVRWGSITYLKDSAVNVELPGARRLIIHGNPWTRKHGNWAFQYNRTADMFSDQFGSDVDVFVTHSPPRHHLDVAGWGDPYLLHELWRVRPKLHVFGHVHAGYGEELLMYDAVQTLYEQICDGRGGYLALVHLALQVIACLLTSPRLGGRSTIAVNASAVGGRLDEQIHKARVVRL